MGRWLKMREHRKKQAARWMLAALSFLVVGNMGTGAFPAWAVTGPPPPVHHPQTKPTGKELANITTTPRHPQASSNPSSPGTRGQGQPLLNNLLRSPDGKGIREAIQQNDILTTPIPTP